jgi:hypothetical protein
LIWTPI